MHELDLTRRVRVELPPEADRDVLAELFESVGGAVERAGASGLVGRFAATEPAFLEDRVEGWLQLVDRSGAAVLWTARGTAADQEGWRGLYAGTDVGRFRIRPPWLPPAAGGIPLVVDPRGAIGSGLHPTTRLTLELLEAELDARRGQTMLDVGAGAGLLSVAAAVCGLRPTALEIEPQARARCRRTALDNGVTVEVSDRPLAEVAGPFPLVTANLPPQTLRTLLPALWSRLAPGGTLLVSGASPEELARWLPAAGLPLPELRVSPDRAWAAAALHAPPLPAAPRRSGP